MTTATLATDHRLTDDEMVSFVINGYHVLQPDLRTGINQEIYDALHALDTNPGDAVLETVPELNDVWDSTGRWLAHSPVCWVPITRCFPIGTATATHPAHRASSFTKTT